MTSASQKVQARTHADRMGAAREMTPFLTAEAAEGEKLTHLTDAAVDHLLQAGFLHLLLPRELGGEQAPYAEAMEVIEQLSYADGSAGWYVMVANAAAASVGAFLPDKGAEIIYGANPRAIVAGQGAPRGTAKPVKGGYLVNGPWGYGSTIFHAQFIHSGCLILGEDGKPVFEKDGSPRGVVVQFPKEQCVLLGNWETLGLRATGSYDYNVAAPDLFVPDDMCYDFTATVPCRGGVKYSGGIVGITAWCHASWALGVIRRALDEIKKIAPQKTGPFGSLGHSATFKQSFAEAESKFRSVRAWLREIWRDMDATLASGRPATLEQLAVARMALRHIHDVGSEVTTFAYRAGGGIALRDGLLQRAYRDMHGATQHVLVADQIFQECARVLLGLTGENARWDIIRVVD